MHQDGDTARSRRRADDQAAQAVERGSREGVDEHSVALAENRGRDGGRIVHMHRFQLFLARCMSFLFKLCLILCFSCMHIFLA